MATKELSNPPKDERSRELWLQHAAGAIIFEDIRAYAFQRIPKDLSPQIQEYIRAGIDDAVYGLMMVLDGVSGNLQNENYTVVIESLIKLYHKNDLIQELNTQEGDGMCMGYHGWLENDFGDDETNPITGGFGM